MSNFEVRPIRSEDMSHLQRVVRETGLFPPEMLSELAEPVLADDGTGLMLCCIKDDRPVALCYAVPEMLADGVWNMLSLGVLPEYQGKGAGRCLVDALEHSLRLKRQRMIIVDTSGTDAFAIARAFYTAMGYETEARIRDYWAEGDDKVTFRKHIKNE